MWAFMGNMVFTVVKCPPNFIMLYKITFNLHLAICLALYMSIAQLWITMPVITKDLYKIGMYYHTLTLLYSVYYIVGTEKVSLSFPFDDCL